MTNNKEEILMVAKVINFVYANEKCPLNAKSKYVDYMHDHGIDSIDKKRNLDYAKEVSKNFLYYYLK